MTRRRTVFAGFAAASNRRRPRPNGRRDEADKTGTALANAHGNASIREKAPIGPV